MTILVTGAAGFVGAATAHALLERGEIVVGIDNLNAYYDVGLKLARLDRMKAMRGFRFIKADLADREAIAAVFSDHRPSRVVHLGAQAGVRYGSENPHAYIDSNIVGFLNILEGCRGHGVEHLVYASSSSVYGANTRVPFKASDAADHPLSLYAATKKANEMMAHAYAHLYGLPVTGLRFFTVYGPWGRPDMAPFIFTRKILSGQPIDVYNHGDHARDFTYIDDIVAGVVGMLDPTATSDPAWNGEAPDPSTSSAPYRIYNIGNNRPARLLDFIGAIEAATGRKAELNMLPMQPGDVHQTFADIGPIIEAIGFSPKTPLDVGIGKFADWYRSFYAVP